MILYLHGFRSSPQSFKARLLAQRLAASGDDVLLAPQLPPSPAQAIELALQLCAPYAADQIALIGSSLGGYYATWLAEQLGCRAALLNPAVGAPQDLQRYIGIHKYFHSSDSFEFRTEYIDQLQSLVVPRISDPQRYFLLAATGDEILDWRQMQAHYAGATMRIIEGSDHGLSDFADHVDAVLAFCQRQ